MDCENQSDCDKKLMFDVPQECNKESKNKYSDDDNERSIVKCNIINIEANPNSKKEDNGIIFCKKCENIFYVQDIKSNKLLQSLYFCECT